MIFMSRKFLFFVLFFINLPLAYSQELSNRLTPRDPLSLKFSKNSDHVIKNLSYDRHDMPCYVFWAKSGQQFTLKSLYDKNDDVRFSIFLPNFTYYHIEKQNQPAFYQDIPEGKTLNEGGYKKPVKNFSATLPESGNYLLCLIIWQDPYKDLPLVQENPSVKFLVKVSQNNVSLK